MRDRTFFGLDQLNDAISEGVKALNARPFQAKEGSRESAYLGQEKDSLIPLPATPYVHMERSRATVNFNYHVAFDKCWYSVPFQYVKREVDISATQTAVVVSCDGRRIALHSRLRGKGAYLTDPGHMPQAHRDFAEWDGDRFRSQAEQVGPSTLAVVESLLASRQVEQQAYAACRALLGLCGKYGADVLEEAGAKALLYSRHPSYKTVRQIADVLASDSAPDPDDHAYLRGADYYRSLGDDAGMSGGEEE